MFALNLVCRDPALRESTLRDLRAVFPSVLSYKVPEEVNEVLYCSEAKKKDAKRPLLDAFRRVNEAVGDADFVDAADALARLKVVA